jgi:hypothetical protein
MTVALLNKTAEPLFSGDAGSHSGVFMTSEDSTWSDHVRAADSAHAFVLNEQGQALILESMPLGNAWSSWQMIGCPLAEGENPITAVQATLRQTTGYTARQWLYLGTFILEEAGDKGARHFFFARDVAQTGPHLPGLAIRWVDRKQIKHALLDGRIAYLNHAVVAALALLFCGGD